MQQVNGVPVYSSDPSLIFSGLDEEPTWFSAQGGVYKCIERSTNKQVAIKKYLVEEDSPYEDMFVMPKELVENEIYSMTKCLHPNILTLHAVYLHYEFVYLIMPLCTGGSLQQYVFENHVTVGQLVYIISSIASGLAKVHGNGYIHRDIKCDNIFLDELNNTIVIGDFGVVSISPAADSSVEEAGVVLFWSPELVQQKIVNHKVDIWALGIVILEVLKGGKAPYEDEQLEEEEIKQRILDNGRPEYPPNLPSLLVDLLDHCLDPNPRTRYSANSVLQHPFLKSCEPELLFPAARMDMVSSESTPSEIDKMEDQTEEDCIMIEKQQRPKCRLPVPAFSVDKTASAAVPVKEKIANVIRKRQNMSDSNRSQGSRIPMLCILQPSIENLEPTFKDNKPVRINSPTNIRQETRLQTPKPLARSNTTPFSHMGKPVIARQQQIKSPSVTTSSIPRRSPLSDIKSNIQQQLKKNKKELPPKCSVYRKRLPAGESRTARLMMGLSSTGRRQSYKSREDGTQVDEHGISPSFSHRFNGKPLHSEDKKRPMSFAASSKSMSQLPIYFQHKSIPESYNKRQSVPAPSANSPENNKHTTKKDASMKTLRVH